MITIDPPVYFIRGKTIFRDHEDPDQFYYLPDAPAIAKKADDSLDANLFIYRRDLTDNPDLEPEHSKGGGIALFDIEMQTSNLEQQVLMSELATRLAKETVKLSPVMFRYGTVRALVAQSQDNQLIENLVETHNSPLTEPFHTSFALGLTPEGATLFEQAMLGGDVPVGVAYELKFLALTPSLHARVTMDYERIYDRFAASVGFTIYYVSARLDLELAWLIENNLINIEITAFTDTADRERQEKLVMSLVKLRIQQDFFRTGIPEKKKDNGAGGALGQLLGGLIGGGEEITSTSALFTLKARYEAIREQKTFELLFNGRTAVWLTHVSSSFLSTMVDETVSANIRKIDLGDDDFFNRLAVNVDVVVDFAEVLDLHKVIVHLQYHDHRKSFEYSPASKEAKQFQAAMPSAGDDRYQYQLEFHMQNRAEPIKVGPADSRSRFLVINPLQYFIIRRIKIIGSFDPVLVPRIHINLSMQDDETNEEIVREQITLDEQTQEFYWRKLLDPKYIETPLRIRADWIDQHGQLVEGEEEKIKDDLYIAKGPFKDTLDIRLLSVANWDLINQVFVELRYQDGDYLSEKQHIFTADNASAQIQHIIPIKDVTKRTYKWRDVIFFKDGSSDEREWQETDKALLLIGKVEPADREVRVIWLGQAGDALGLRVSFTATDRQGDEQQTSVLLQPGETQKVVKIPLNTEGKLSYAYTVDRFTMAGQETIRTGTGETDILIIQPTT